MQLATYIRAVLAQATYRVNEQDGLVYGEIPGFEGVKARGHTILECRHTLIEHLEDWIEFRLSRGLAVPVVNGISLPVNDSY